MGIIPQSSVQYIAILPGISRFLHTGDATRKTPDAFLKPVLRESGDAASAMAIESGNRAIEWGWLRIRGETPR